MAENKQPVIDKSRSGLKSFPPQYWLTIMFEFFERGSYYGMMSVLAVYLTDILGFSKEGVGVITGTIQPILYFLPIISGALADRFGYRKALTVAFALLGGGYFLTSQMTGYTTVFLTLCVMALGAGTFKPIISGSIARMTTKENSTLGFGVFYWTINLGAFLFPLFLIPYLKNNIGWNWVFIAAALGTGAMLIPTLLFFKEPPRPKGEKKKETNLVQTIANAFEIIYSPFILIANQLKAKNGRGILAYAFIILFGIGAVYSYLQVPAVEEKLNSHVFSVAGNELMITVDRNVMGSRDYAITARERHAFPPYNLTLMTEAKNDRRELFAPLAQDGNDLQLTLYSTNLDSIFTLVSAELKPFFAVERDTLELIVQNLLTRQNNQFDLTVYKPDAFEKYAAELLPQLQENPGFAELTQLQLGEWIKAAEKPTSLTLTVDENASGVDGFEIVEAGAADYQLRIADVSAFSAIKNKALNQLRSFAPLALIPQSRLDKMVLGTKSRSFLWLFIFLLLITSLAIIAVQPIYKTAKTGKKSLILLGFCLFIAAVIWMLPGLGTFGRIISTVIYATVLSLFLIDFSDLPKFKDHFHFLLMIFLYAGFWILYFQMFGSVLWYVKAYVDASSLNTFVSNLLGINWHFDVEHVTVINAGTIILLQLLISNLVKNTKALPTMIGGIFCATIGMFILSISSSIWVFMAGIILFSIGEMTAHPKFISYVGQTAPRDRVATYMGYIFLYGVIGSSIGSVLGAKMYVHFVDNLHQPKTLWLIFSFIGVGTIVALLLYNKLVKPAEAE